jgi:hypothetical protein
MPHAHLDVTTGLFPNDEAMIEATHKVANERTWSTIGIVPEDDRVMWTVQEFGLRLHYREPEESWI